MHTQFQHLFLTKKDRTDRSERGGTKVMIAQKRTQVKINEKKLSKIYEYVLTCLQKRP